MPTVDDENERVLEDGIAGSEGPAAPNNAPRSQRSLASLVQVRMKFVSMTLTGFGRRPFQLILDSFSPL